MTQMISIFDDAVYGDVFYNGNGDKYYYVRKTDANGDDNPFPYHLVTDKEFDWNKKPDDYVSVCCYCASGAICWAVIDHWDEKHELYKKTMIVKKGEREEPTTK